MKRSLSYYYRHYGSNFLGIIICLPFGAAGLYITFLLFNAAYRKGTLANPAVMLILGALLLFSGLFFYGCYRSIRKVTEAEDEIESADIHPGIQPWMMNREWREKKILGYTIAPGQASPFFKWLGIIVLIVFPVSILVFGVIYNLNKEGFNQDNIIIIIVIALLLALFAYLYLKKRKFGKSICHLITLPAYIGKNLEAEIEVEFPGVKRGMPPLPGSDVDISLQLCTISGGGRTAQIYTLKLFNQSLPKEKIIRPGNGRLVIPVNLEIEEAPARFELNKHSSKRVFWRLSVGAKFRGIDYHYYFNVPVY